MKSKPIWQFIGLTILISAIPYYFMLSENDKESAWVLALMWSPALAAITLKGINKENLFKHLQWSFFKKIHYLFLFSLIPFIIQIVSILLVLLFGFGEFDSSFISLTEGNVAIRKVALLFGAEAQSIWLFIPHFLISFFVGSLAYMFLTIGEEYGWRGYLQSYLVDAFGFKKGIVVLGIVWGLWHAPAIIFLGQNYPSYPIIGAFILMPIMCILLSFVFASFFSLKNNIWIPVILHSSLNGSVGFTDKAILVPSQNLVAIDVIWTSLWLISAFVIYRILSKNKELKIS
jgi:membrane protease YdiL (CAAX protease family)